MVFNENEVQEWDEVEGNRRQAVMLKVALVRHKTPVKGRYQIEIRVGERQVCETKICRNFMSAVGMNNVCSRKISAGDSTPRA